MNTSCGVISCITAIVILIISAICLCILMVAIGLFGSIDNFNYDFSGPGINTGAPTPEANFMRPELLDEQSSVSTETLMTLENTNIPENNPRDLAMRLGGQTDIPETLPPPQTPFQLGAQQTFWVSNSDTSENFEVSATLRYITDHVYFWIQDGTRYTENDVRALVDNFEQHTYPTVTSFFGSEWNPGVDGDPHLYILYVHDVGNSIAGYFSSMDEYHPLVNKYSNGHEMFILSADNAPLDDNFTYGVLAHEFQHMIHWYQDANEET